MPRSMGMGFTPAAAVGVYSFVNSDLHGKIGDGSLFVGGSARRSNLYNSQMRCLLETYLLPAFLQLLKACFELVIVLHLDRQTLPVPT
jgi:hypothetical protein